MKTDNCRQLSIALFLSLSLCFWPIGCGRENGMVELSGYGPACQYIAEIKGILSSENDHFRTDKLVAICNNIVASNGSDSASMIFLSIICAFQDALTRYEIVSAFVLSGHKESREAMEYLLDDKETIVTTFWVKAGGVEYFPSKEDYLSDDRGTAILSVASIAAFGLAKLNCAEGCNRDDTAQERSESSDF